MTGYAMVPKCVGCNVLLMPKSDVVKVEWLDSDGNPLSYDSSGEDNFIEYLKNNSATMQMTCLKCGEIN